VGKIKVASIIMQNVQYIYSILTNSHFPRKTWKSEGAFSGTCENRLIEFHKQRCAREQSSSLFPDLLNVRCWKVWIITGFVR